MHPSASPLVTAGMAAIVALVAIALILGVARVAPSHRAKRRFGGGVAAWLVIVAAAGLSGVLRHEGKPPPLVVLLVVAFVLVIAVARSPVGTRLAEGLPLAALIGFQGFRLPLELVLHRAATEGTMPVQMSFSGYNFDIVSGASAILVAWLVARGSAPRWLTLGWAVLSSVLLATIIVIAVASTPAIAAFGRSPERLNTWVGYFPFVWLPAVLVPAALLGQILVFRRLARDARGPVSGRTTTPGPARRSRA